MEHSAAASTATTSAFKYEGWSFASTKSHIIKLYCTTPSVCSSVPEDVVSPLICTYCRFKRSLRLPQYPDMLFADNALSVTHMDSGASISFTPLDALQRVDAEHDLVRVWAADEWAAARSECPFVRNMVRPFDWTYTTDYAGTVTGLVETTTQDRIDLDRLRVQESILYYEETMLYEDELADNGTSCLSVRVRCMPSGWFVLLRFHLRVDRVMLQVNDTRLRWELGWPYVLREWSARKKTWSQLSDKQLERVMDTNWIAQQLDLTEERVHKLLLPSL